VTNPLTGLANTTTGGVAPHGPLVAYLATVTAVNTTTATATIDCGDGAPLSGVMYLGPAPVVGRQVLYLTFHRTAVILGGG